MRVRARRRREPGAEAVAAVAALQALAAVFFIVDAAGDVAAQGVTWHVAIEGVIAVALLAGVVTGSLQLREILAAGRRKSAALAVAAGALSEVIQERVQAWGLTPAEADVAVFALKGCDVAEIAALRNSAPGTVRAQLARVYEKAGVRSRSDLASLFLEDLIAAPERPGR
ncbi:helix-turn-helix transcriptional regulator [Phenylobacterium sp.]|uniref:helix-turn-helix transcriptional regulator n=1 Tax=Phenylobacterium sp. TaxID=1871053 RepID=UPI002C1DA3D7|nr:helix-turn-helix transcriptional regulator [Phenylobacterium sp.]HVI34435.1 helix-turn-helix transcriptional regulator [Phenylobacterium sp.]